ncbi:MAG: DsbA family protein [Sedimenticola sp.]
MQKTLFYIYDPMCSWCWAFRPVWQEIVQRLQPVIAPKRLLGGLAIDSDEPMPMAMQLYLQKTWRTIQQQLPETEFNHDFWSLCQPRRSTWPACRAVIAAREQGAVYEGDMIEAIQQAYYLRALNPSDRDILITLAQEIGLDIAVFAQQLDSDTTRKQLEQEMAQGLAMGVRSFPSLVLQDGAGYRQIEHHYLDAPQILNQL